MGDTAELTEIEREFAQAAGGGRRVLADLTPSSSDSNIRGPAGVAGRPSSPSRLANTTSEDPMSDHDPRDEAPAPRRARGDGPRRPDRHDRRRHHGHAGPAHGQARPGPGVPRRRHLPRRPLLHVPARHGHGDEHARGLQAHELGDRLRRLDRRADLGPAAGPALAAGHGDGPRRHHRRGDRRGDPDLAADHPQAPGRAGREGRVRAQGRLGVRVLRPQGLVGGPRRARLAGPAERSGTTTRTTTCSRRPRRSRSIACCATR